MPLPAVPDWIVTVGIEGRVVPAWPGAAESAPAVTGFPLFSVRKRGLAAGLSRPARQHRL